MRIRKNAAKLLLLGSASTAASLYSSDSWPPPTACFSSSATVDATSGEALCELNCSPWDVMAEDELLNYCSSPPYSFVTDPNHKKDEQDGDRGIIGNIIKPEDHPNIAVATFTSSCVAEAKQYKEDKPKARKREAKINNDKSIVSEITTAKYSEEIIYCKKTDGRRWRCKRPAQVPHYFCGYHIEQCRSYNSAIAGADREMQWRSAVAEADVTGSNYYYYYCGFGPRRVKRRSGCGDGEDSQERHVDHADNNVARDDDGGVVEFCLVDCLDADDDNCYDGCSEEEDKDSVNKQQGGEKKRLLVKKKKKARTRSLKSLL